MRRKLLTAILAFSAFAVQAQITVEAESGDLVGTEVKTEGSVSFVTGLDADTDMFTETVTLPDAGFYTVAFTYRGSDQKIQHFLVNGGVYADVTFPASSSWTTANLGSVYFKAGKNTFSIKKSWGHNDFDKFTLTKETVTPHDYSTIEKAPINPNADDNAKALYTFLLNNYGKYIISGQTDSYYDNIVDLTKKHPILRSFDMTSYCNHNPWGWNNTTATHDWQGCYDDGTVQKAIDWYKSTNKKGIVAVHWHWQAPLGGKPGVNNFYTANNDFDITKAVTPGTAEYNAIIKDIDTVSKYLLKFKEAGVPIMWRPLHEAGGGWFWWGAKGAAPCKALWDTIYNRMVNKYQLNNMIWVWSTPEKDWYLGNDKLDVFGYDSYPGEYEYTAQKPLFETMFSMVDGKKMVTLSENGPIPNPQDCFDMDAKWSFFMSWAELVLAQNTTDHIKDVYIHPKVLSLEDLDKLTQTVPSVAFRAPENNKYYVEGASITATAVPFSANSTIDSVVFYVDNIKKQVSTSLPMASYTFEGLAVGAHTIRVRTYDATGKWAESEITETIVALSNVVITLTPAEASLLPTGTATFAATVSSKDGNACEGANLSWTVNGGGTVTKLSATSALFTPTEQSGTFTITASQGVASVSTSIEISECPTTKIPLASKWTTQNGWYDQNNGSVATQTTDALVIKARKWGKADLLAVQSGEKISVTKDSKYTVAFDFKNDPNYPVASFEMSLATTWGIDKVTAYASQTETITAPTGSSFTRINKTFVATATQNAYLSLALTWSKQPDDTAHLTIKNLQICQEAAQTAVPATAATGVTVLPNPATLQVTIVLAEQTLNGKIVAISAAGTRTALAAGDVTDTSITLSLGELAAGVYTLEIPTNTGIVNKKLVVVK